MLQTSELSMPEYERSLKRQKKADAISIALYHIKRVRQLESLLEIKESRPTVRAKRPVQQRKVDICPKCSIDGTLYNEATGKWDIVCDVCGGTGKLSPVA